MTRNSGWLISFISIIGIHIDTIFFFLHTELIQEEKKCFSFFASYLFSWSNQNNTRKKTEDGVNVGQRTANVAISNKYCLSLTWHSPLTFITAYSRTTFSFWCENMRSRARIHAYLCVWSALGIYLYRTSSKRMNWALFVCTRNMCTTCTYMNLIICTIFLLLMWVLVCLFEYIFICFATSMCHVRCSFHASFNHYPLYTSLSFSFFSSFSYQNSSYWQQQQQQQQSTSI